MDAAALSSHEVFSFLHPDEVSALSDVSEVVSFRAGETVFRSGEPSDSLYAVLEGNIRLQLPRVDDFFLHIEDLPTGALFGSCICFDIHEYTLTAVCASDATLLKVSSKGLDRVMRADPVTGLQIQRLISRTYFKRYLAAMEKLRSIAEAVPLQRGGIHRPGDVA